MKLDGEMPKREVLISKLAKNKKNVKRVKFGGSPVFPPSHILKGPGEVPLVYRVYTSKIPVQAAAPCVHCVWTRDGAGDLKGLAKPSRFRTGAVTKKTEKSGATFRLGRLRCEKCAKSRVSRFRSKVASSSLGRFFLGNFRDRARWGARRSRANKAKVKANPNHSRSLVFFSMDSFA